MGTGIGKAREANGDHGGHRAEAEDYKRQDQQRQHGKLHFLGFDLLAEIIRRASHHESGDEDRDDGNHQDAIEAGADTARQNFAELDDEQRDKAAQGA